MAILIFFTPGAPTSIVLSSFPSGIKSSGIEDGFFSIDLGLIFVFAFESKELDAPLEEENEELLCA